MKKQIFFLLLFILLNNNLFAQCFSKVSSGNVHVSAKKTDGTLWVWGSGVSGALGNISEMDEYSPIQLGTTADWQEIKAGSQNTFAIKNNGALWATGSNITGELGIGSTTVYTSTLTQIGTATNWKTIAPSNFFTIAMKTDNTLWGWGQNDGYQMGNGTCCTNQLSPIQISTATDWKMIATSQGRSAFALKNNGALWCWGTNLFALLGDNLVGSRPFPTQHNLDTDWDKISLTYGHILALKTNGTLWSWGGGGNGETGDGLPANYNRFTPLQIGTATNWVTIYSGYNTSFGIKADGTLWAWGRNNLGQLGVGGTTNQPFPVQVGTATNWSSVSGGYEHTVALKTDGSFWAWGSNLFGQLGNGTNVNQPLPVLIPVTGCALTTEAFTIAKIVVIISPNPASNELTLHYKGNENVTAITIYDVTGKEVYNTEALGNNAFMTTFTIANLQSGIYVVSLKNGDKIVVSKKFVKE